MLRKCWKVSECICGRAQPVTPFFLKTAIRPANQLTSRSKQLLPEKGGERIREKGHEIDMLKHPESAGEVTKFAPVPRAT